MRNRYLEAFKEGGNLLGLAGFAALSAALLNPVPLAIGLALELVYLAFVPDLKWYQARLSKLFDADVEKRRKEIKDKLFKHLRPEMKERFERLEDTRKEIGEQSASDEAWFREILRKLDFLMEKFLQFAGKEAQFRSYLISVLEELRKEDGSSRIAREARSKVDQQDVRGYQRRSEGRPQLRAVPGGPPRAAAVIAQEDRWVLATVAEVQAHYDRDLAGVRQLAEAEPDPSTQAVLNKRVKVLSRRREFIEKIGRIMINLNHQLCLLEDTFGLISDEMRARPPEQVLADIEDVVTQTNSMTQALEEMAPFEQMLERRTA